MNQYKFKTSNNVKQYCDQIVNKMMTEFNISQQEAVGRVNRQWSHCSYIGGDDDMIFHMLPEEWAYDIYYGSSSLWWQKDKKELIPLPFDEER